MVGIEPCYLGWRHQAPFDETGVVETEREGLESEPLVVSRCGRCLRGRDNGNEVLGADTPLACAVDTRFIRDDMSHLEGRRVIVGPYILRSFVAAEEMADTVTRTVTEGDTRFPHKLLGERIQLIAPRASRETHRLQRYVAFEHVGIVQLGLLGDIASEPYGTGDIGRAVQVLTAAVEQ